MRRKAKCAPSTESTLTRRSGTPFRVGRAREGRSALVVLGFLALLAAIGGWFLAGDNTRDSGDSSARAQAEVAPKSSNGELRLEGASGQRTSADETATNARTGDLAFGTGAPGSELRFEGTGELRGSVQLLDATEPPAAWQLELRPHPFERGREFALEKKLFLTGESLDFQVPELPFAAYEVRAVAEGFNGRWTKAVIDRTSTSPFLNLQLRRAGYLTGFVVDVNSVPLPDMAVTLVGLADGAHFESTTDAAGQWRIDLVPDGQYELVVGSVNAPYTSPERLEFRAPSMTFPPIEIRNLASAVVTIVSEGDEPIWEAKLSGHSTGGGTFEVKTDVFGVAQLPLLGAGKTRITIEHPEYKTHRVNVPLEAGTDKPFAFALSRK